jgi:zinc protease
MGAVPGGRLHKSLVAPKLAVNSESAVDSFLEPGLVGFYATPTLGGDPSHVERILLEQVEGLSKQPFNEEEVRAAKQRLANMYERASKSNVLGVANALSESIAAGDWRLGFVYRDAIAKVTVADVNRVAKTYLVSANRTLARFIPTAEPMRVEIPPAPDVSALVSAYKGGPAVTSGEVFDNSLLNIQARTQTLVLGEGLNVALLPKKSRGDRVSAELMFHFGDEESTAGRLDAASFAGNLLMRGTKTMTREQIAQRFDDLKARVSVVGAGGMAYIGIDTDRANLLPALRLAAEVLRNPSFPEDEFEQIRSQSITALEGRKKGPGYIADYAMRKHFDPWPPGHPRAVRSEAEELAAIKAVKLEDVRAFHREFYGTARGEAVVVGDFDAVALQRELDMLFTSWKSPKPFVRTSEPYFQPKKVVREVFETPDKANAVIVSRSNFPIQVDDPDHPALLVASRIFGGGAKASRLGDRVREEEGLSYYVGSGVIISPEDANGIFYMQATSAPENMVRVEAAMREELQRFVRDGVTAQELEDSKAGLLSSYRDGRSNDGSIASSLRTNLYLGRTMQWDADFEGAVSRLTQEQVNEAIRRRLKPEIVSTFVAGDFAAGKKRIVLSK